MPSWDYVCTVCGTRVTLTFKNVAARDDWAGRVCCDEPCLGTLERQPSAPNFSIKGFNAQNGYS